MHVELRRHKGEVVYPRFCFLEGCTLCPLPSSLGCGGQSGRQGMSSLVAVLSATANYLAQDEGVSKNWCLTAEMPPSPRDRVPSLLCWPMAVGQLWFLMGDAPQFWQWGYTLLLMPCHSASWFIAAIRHAVCVDWKHQGSSLFYWLL
jgi:hypothetical protein